jgi:hypothetical protein
MPLDRKRETPPLTTPIFSDLHSNNVHARGISDSFVTQSLSAASALNMDDYDGERGDLFDSSDDEEVSPLPDTVLWNI